VKPQRLRGDIRGSVADLGGLIVAAVVVSILALGLYDLAHNGLGPRPSVSTGTSDSRPTP
jgi:hypothetical protein